MRIHFNVKEFLRKIFPNFPRQIEAFRNIRSYGLPRKKKELKQKAAFAPLSGKVDLLPIETHRKWLLVRISAVLIFLAFAGVLYFGHVVLSLRFSIIPLVERGEYLTRECTRLHREVREAKNYISSGGVSVLGNLPKPRAFLPPPWSVPGVVDTLCFSAQESGVYIDALEYSAESFTLGKIEAKLWWAYEPRDLHDPLTDFIKIISGEKIVTRIIVANEKRIVGSARADIIIWVSPIKNKFSQEKEQFCQG